MIAVLALALVAADFGELPPQKLPDNACATFLWARTEPPRRIAMIDETQNALVIVRHGKKETLAQTGPGTYAGRDLTIRVDLAMDSASGVGQEQIIRQGALRIDRPDRTTEILSVGGLRGCR